MDELIACIHREYISDVRDMSVIRNACSLLVIEIGDPGKTSDTELDIVCRHSSVLKEIFEICTTDVIILENTFEMVCILIDTLKDRKMHLSLNNRHVYRYFCNILTCSDFRQNVRSLQIINEIMSKVQSVQCKNDMMCIRSDDINMKEFMLVDGMKSLLTFSKSTYDDWLLTVSKSCCECYKASIHKNILELVYNAYDHYSPCHENTAENMHLFVLYALEQKYSLNDDILRRINNIVYDYGVSQFSHVLVEIIRSPSYPRCSFHVNDMAFRLLRNNVKSAFESAGGSRELIQNKLQLIREEYNCENITEYYSTTNSGHSIFEIRKCLYKLYNDDSDRNFVEGFQNYKILQNYEILQNYKKRRHLEESDSDLDESDSDLDESDSDLDESDSDLDESDSD
jgi:hypothetical protein